MRIAFIGVKGLPGTFSGIETHVHELGTRLVQRGHEVFAYVRPHYTPRDVTEDDGIQLIHLPTVPSKHLDATVHSFLAALNTNRKGFDIVHFHAIGPASFGLLSRPSGACIVSTIHRFDYLSGKWGWFARACLQLAEQICLRVSDRTIVIAPWLKAHYNKRGHSVEYIPNGVTLPEDEIGSEEIAHLGLAPNGFCLFLGRLVPEKRPDWAIRAFLAASSGAERLVIAGGSSATDRYVQELKALAEPAGDRVLFTGPVYGRLKDQLQANAKAFLLPSALEGLPITLLEAMSHSRPCLVSDIPPHRDVVVDGHNAFLHKDGDFEHLCERLREILTADPARLEAVGRAARKTVADDFNWDDIVDSTERLYESALAERGRRRVLD